MIKNFKIIFFAVSFTLLPAVFTYLAQSNNALNWLQEKKFIGSGIDVNYLKDVCVLLSVILTFFLLTIKLIRAEINEENLRKQRDGLLGQWKNIFVNSFGKNLNVKNLNMEIRIFVPRITLYTLWMRLRKKKEYKLNFVIRNVEALAKKDMTENLMLEVMPNPVGLVGRCYNEKGMLFDDDLRSTNESKYNLSAYQKAKTNQLRFSLVCPIFNNKDEIVSILAFDSQQEIKIDTTEKNRMVGDSILSFSQMLYQNVPELFGSKGGF